MPTGQSHDPRSWRWITAEQVQVKLRALDNHPLCDAFGSLLASKLARHAPHHLSLLPPAWVAHATADDAR